ncbi:hypothetical protein SAMN04488005_0455 [Yoonia tamlensis]|uniref:HNH endonuclease n=1 Tax=Yoonia tamlensis TaxID=390270 RepID=A0A1I6FTI8_9RHOB|nr:hypothetical protein [Yoonia tamlensis]SFR33218.1 hypothetical protein SAMN04488005_0455 [Yoonia tamlensis]
MTRSANDDAAEALIIPTIKTNGPKITDFLPKYPEAPAGPDTSLSMTDLFTFASRSMHLRNSIVCWKRDGGYDAVTPRYGNDLELYLTFKRDGQTQIVRHADVAWMLCHDQPIPEGHKVEYSNGNVRDTHRFNLWLVNNT